MCVWYRYSEQKNSSYMANVKVCGKTKTRKPRVVLFFHFGFFLGNRLLFSWVLFFFFINFSPVARFSMERVCLFIIYLYTHAHVRVSIYRKKKIFASCCLSIDAKHKKKNFAVILYVPTTRIYYAKKKKLKIFFFCRRFCWVTPEGFGESV